MNCIYCNDLLIKSRNVYQICLTCKIYKWYKNVVTLP